jgi:hypothetical protein
MTSKPHLISGRVHDADGRPAAGARIYFTASPAVLADMALLTDQNGRFTLAAPVEGTYQIGCNADGFAPTTATVKVTDAEPAQVEIKLRRP